MNKHILIIGHRGTRVKYDENTLESIDIAFNSGAELVEFDIRLSKDGKIVVFHDETIERTTNGSGPLKMINYFDLKKYRTKNRKCVVPLVDDIFEKFKRPKKLMIELKDISVKEKFIEKVNANNLGNRIVVSGRDFNVLCNIKLNIPKCQVCYNITKGKGLDLSQFVNEDFNPDVQSQIDMVSLRSRLISSKFIEICHKQNLKALAWDFINYKNPLKKIKELINLGMDGILFDDYRNIEIITNWLKTV